MCRLAFLKKDIHHDISKSGERTDFQVEIKAFHQPRDHRKRKNASAQRIQETGSLWSNYYFFPEITAVDNGKISKGEISCMGWCFHPQMRCNQS